MLVLEPLVGGSIVGDFESCLHEHLVFDSGVWTDDSETLLVGWSVVVQDVSLDNLGYCNYKIALKDSTLCF